MILHFEPAEFKARRAPPHQKDGRGKTGSHAALCPRKHVLADRLHTFGHCFFQTLIVKADGTITLLTRSSNLRQACHPSNIENIVIRVDRLNANPTLDLKNLMSEMDLLGCRVGIEFDTPGRA